MAAAVELFARRGLHAVTSHEIARAAGVAAGTFYLHFRDKQELFREIVFAALDELRGRLDRASESARERAEVVHARSQALLGFAEENRDLVLVLFGREHGAADLEYDVLEYLGAAAEENLRAQIALGTVRADLDPRVAGRALVAMQAQVLTWWIEDPTRAPRASVIDTLTGLQLWGTAPRPEA